MSSLQNNLCYFLFLNQSSFKIKDYSMKNDVPTLVDGLYAYIVYQLGNARFLALRELHNYASDHGALHLIAQYKLGKRQAAPRFFSQATKPLFGGEMLWHQQEIRCWDFQSGGFSAQNPLYTDEYPNWQQVVEQSRLPSTRFLKIAQAQQYKPVFLPMRYDLPYHPSELHFKPDGQFTYPAQTNQVVDQILDLAGPFTLRPPQPLFNLLAYQ